MCYVRTYVLGSTQVGTGKLLNLHIAILGLGPLQEAVNVVILLPLRLGFRLDLSLHGADLGV